MLIAQFGTCFLHTLFSVIFLSFWPEKDKSANVTQTPETRKVVVVVVAVEVDCLLLCPGLLELLYFVCSRNQNIYC